MPITKAIDAAERINDRLSRILAGEYPDDRQVTIPAAYLNLSLDHHKAIILLFRINLCGSGLALVRSVFEAMLRAHWVVGCAKPTEVDQVAENPDFDVMARVDADHIDEAFQTDEFFRRAKKDAWKAMNDYTHSGLGQLSRQFSRGRIEASYADEDLLEGLRASTASVLLLGYLLAKKTGRNEQAEEIKELFNQVP